MPSVWKIKRWNPFDSKILRTLRYIEPFGAILAVLIKIKIAKVFS